MVVCPNCVREKKAKAIARGIRGQAGAKEIRMEKPQEPSHPPDWDGEGEYLQRFAKTKAKSTIMAQRVDDEHVKFSCPKCSYVIKFDTVKKTPASCPYCSTGITGN